MKTLLWVIGIFCTFAAMCALLKTSFFGLTLLILSLSAKAQNAFMDTIRPAVSGVQYGAPIQHESELVDINQIPSLLAQSNNDTLQTTVTATVLDVCPKKGCWMNLAMEDGSTIFVKMKDYAFFVPLSIEGKKIAIEGIAYKQITSVEELQHYAKDAKKSKEEIAAITQPEKSIRFLASGIKVLN